MKRVSAFSLLVWMCFYTMAQNVTLSFTGRDINNCYVQLNRIHITNHTQGWQKNLFWPDTTLTMQHSTNMTEWEQEQTLQFSQNNPNPFKATTDINLSVTKEGMTTLAVADVNGRVLATHTLCLQMGIHSFHINLAATGTYVLSACQNGQTSSIKMVCNGSGTQNKIEYQGLVKMQDFLSFQSQSHSQTYPIIYGDNIEYVGYATINGIEIVAQNIAQAQGTSQTFILRFVETEKQQAEVSSITTSNLKTELGKAQKSEGTEKANDIGKTNDFRVALSLSPFSLNQFEQGYSFVVGNKTASTPAELQKIYRELGSTEMYVRIGTKRHKTDENTVDGKPDENANVHTFDQAIQLCRIAAELNIPINPEIMCAYTYMDMMESQGPRFEEYAEIYALQNGKEWSELTLDEICTVLEAYGTFIGEAILKTGCTVNNWNLGNEANFCFAGIGIKAKTAVNPRLAKTSNLKRYLAPIFSVWWLKKHVWQYNAAAYAAVKRGILKAYEKLGMDVSSVKFSTHIATVVFPPRCSVKFFNYMKEKGYEMDVAGISYYPSAPSMSANRKKLLKKTVTKINDKCGLKVFIGEFSYPSGKMEGAFAGWNKKLKGYKHNQQGQANIYADVIKWGKKNGLDGIRYWAPDYEGWYSMSMFEFANKKGTAKDILQNHKELISK